MRVEARYDAAAETRRLVIVRTHHGTPHLTALDADFLASGDGAQIRAAADVLQGLIQAGAVIKRGDKQLAVKSFKEALDWLFAEARANVAIQRYKGLGRDESGAALGDDHGSRRAPAAQGADRGLVASEEIFSTLMGDEVEPRRAFIESNALGVRNLDV